jgi:predicted nucleic-acid-binding protein
MNKTRCFLDTNSLVRYIVLDNKKMAFKTSQILESGNCYILESVFCELEYVLKKIYSFDRKNIILVFRSFIEDGRVLVSGQLKKAVYIFEENNLDMVDCLVIAHAENNDLFTFDKKMQRVFRKLRG